MWQVPVQTLLKKVNFRKRLPQLAEDRRRYERVRMVLMVICQNAESNDQFVLVTENMSIWGMKFVSLLELRPGETIDVNIPVNSNYRNIAAHGRVVWCEKRTSKGKKYYEGGIEFLTMDPADRNYLEKVIHSCREN